MSLALLARVAAALDRVGAQHALVGAGALAAHGVARSTFDLDLLTTDPAALEAGTWAGLSSDPNLTVSVRRGDAEDPLAGVVRVEASGERPVDVVVGRWRWQADAVESAAPIELAGTTLRVVAAADLILLKLYAGGSQDLADVAQLLAVTGHSVAAAVEIGLERLPQPARRAWERILEVRR